MIPQQLRRDVALSIRLPQEPHPPRRAHGCRRQYHRPFGVVNKCTLSEFSDNAPFFSPKYNGGFGIGGSYISKAVVLFWGGTVASFLPSMLDGRLLSHYIPPDIYRAQVSI